MKAEVDAVLKAGDTVGERNCRAQFPVGLARTQWEAGQPNRST
jgi:hypothetical protein